MMDMTISICIKHLWFTLFSLHGLKSVGSALVEQGDTFTFDDGHDTPTASTHCSINTCLQHEVTVCRILLFSLNSASNIPIPIWRNKSLSNTLHSMQWQTLEPQRFRELHPDPVLGERNYILIQFWENGISSWSSFGQREFHPDSILGCVNWPPG